MVQPFYRYTDIGGSEHEEALGVNSTSWVYVAPMSRVPPEHRWNEVLAIRVTNPDGTLAQESLFELSRDQLWRLNDIGDDGVSGAAPAIAPGPDGDLHLAYVRSGLTPQVVYFAGTARASSARSPQQSPIVGSTWLSTLRARSPGVSGVTAERHGPGRALRAQVRVRRWRGLDDVCLSCTHAGGYFGSPNVTVDEQGRAHVVYGGRERLGGRYGRLDGTSTFTVEAVPLNNPSGDSWVAPSVAIRDGQVHVMYNATDVFCVTFPYCATVAPAKALGRRCLGGRAAVLR